MRDEASWREFSRLLCVSYDNVCYRWLIRVRRGRDVKWAIGAVFVVMVGLYVWAERTANREVRKRVQPLIDDVLGSSRRDSEDKS